MLFAFISLAGAQEHTADEAGLVLSPAAITIDEGATATYTVALKTRPTGNLRVKLQRSSYGIFFKPHRSELAFTPENWNVPQPVTLRAPQDDDALDGAEAVYHLVYGSGYTGPRRVDLAVAITDDDAAALESLVLEGATLNETFAPGRTSYTATVGEEVETVTLRAVAKDDHAELTIPQDRNAKRAGVQVDLNEGENVIAVRVVARNGGNRTYTITVTRPARFITAAFANHPELHVGRPFAVELKLSAYAWISHQHMRERAFTVTGGRIGAVRRLSTRTVTVDGKRYRVSNRWRLSMRPDGDRPVTLSLAAARSCDDPGAICTPTGHPVGNDLSLTVRGPEGVTVSLHPPSGPTSEGADQMLFTLRISRALPRPVIFCWRTVETTPPASTDICPWAATEARPGSATPGADYLRYSGFFLLDPGQTSQELGVGLFDDSIDDNGETVRVEVAHVRFLNSDRNPGVSIPIGTSEAVGVIANTGAIPSGWLVRFGRTVAEQVVDAVRDRGSATRRPSTAGRLAGRAIEDPACNAGEVHAPTALSRRTLGLPERARPTRAGLPSGASRTAGDGTPSAGNGRCEERNVLPGGNPGSRLRDPTPEEAIAGTSLALDFATAQSGVSGEGSASLWLKGASTRFDGLQGGVAVDGTVTSGLFGVDYGQERWSSGLAMSVSRGKGTYRGESSGTIEATLTGLYPWGRYAANDRLRLWGVAGYGAGALRLTPDAGPAMETDIGLKLAALGLESALLVPGPAGGPRLEAVSDLLGLRTTSEAVQGVAGSRARATRLRAGLRGSWTFRYGDGKAGEVVGTGNGGATVTPSLELGLRHDGGDAETGLGLELAGGLAWSDASLGLTARVRVHALQHHADGDFKVNGVSGALSWDRSPSSLLGPSLSLRSGLGATSTSGAAVSFGPAPHEGVRGGDEQFLQPRLEGVLGYGLPAFGGRLVGVPELGASLSDEHRTYRLGWRLSPAAGHTGSNTSPGFASFDLSVEVMRHGRTARVPEHELRVQFKTRF